jgi:hypothetical protein
VKVPLGIIIAMILENLKLLDMIEHELPLSQGAPNS